eukprot:CAMPEP_0116091514 /NCGR_PEP_ID=MMETSP0327-20121206/7545_1 /TAXON_ID=44447 /ORGANISM="Pseudo-nitzschia delicatissima, Strain B596" /LENGTH=294 /DNA_ID=CAMNT_0003582869 /DNA_START=26 /DNA_END=913 /DNA_ORIENTATION=-
MKIGFSVSCWLPAAATATAATAVWLALFSKSVTSFTTTQNGLPWPTTRLYASSSTTTTTTTTTTWENLVPDNDAAPVLKSILEKAATDAETTTPSKGETVTIEYSASLWMNPDEDMGCSIPSWDTNAVLECWLSEQQGLSEILAQPFEEYSIDGSKLLDEELFTETFVAETLGVDNKIRCKKTIMAAKRLRSTLAEYKCKHGLVFDSSDSKPDGVYKFVVGAGKTIRAMELLVGSMKVGETSRVVARCDYGYGADGCRTAKGDVLVPPFCGLQFDVKLTTVVSAETETETETEY